MSIDLAWLSRHDKDLPILLVWSSVASGGSACCYQPWPSPAALAHEWRHHWQSFNDPVKIVTPWTPAASDEYKHSIIRFFQGNRWERDALRYQLEVAADEWAIQWASWLNWPTRLKIFSLPVAKNPLR